LEKTQKIGKYSHTVISTVVAKYLGEIKLFCKLERHCVATTRMEKISEPKGQE